MATSLRWRTHSTRTNILGCVVPADSRLDVPDALPGEDDDVDHLVLLGHLQEGDSHQSPTSISFLLELFKLCHICLPLYILFLRSLVLTHLLFFKPATLHPSTKFWKRKDFKFLHVCNPLPEKVGVIQVSLHYVILHIRSDTQFVPLWVSMHSEQRAIYEQVKIVPTNLPPLSRFIHTFPSESNLPTLVSYWGVSS